MITCIQIEGLFGRFDYTIAQKHGGITIITGPNGFGKSTILRMIDALSRGAFAFFYELDFGKLVVEFDNNKNVTIKRTNKNLTIDGAPLPLSTMPSKEYVKRIQHSPWIERTEDGFVDIRTGEVFLQDEYPSRLFFEDRHYFDAPLGKDEIKRLDELKEKMAQIRKWCGDVRFISDQRLIQTGSKHAEAPRVIDVIRDLPQRLKSQISKVSEEYSRVSNLLDSTYPKRLFAAKDGIKDQGEYAAHLREANAKFEKLSAYNLMDMSIIDEKDYNPTYSTALKIYFDDFNEKYRVFQELITKLELFTQIINSRLTFKQIRITRDKGFEIVDNDNPQKILKLSQLSSGEKQEIVLFYELIFDTKKERLLLIDEPEISLHIIWQKMFLDDLIKVSSVIGLQVIVATHSPQIISNHLDIQIDLGELYGRKLDTV